MALRLDVEEFIAALPVSAPQLCIALESIEENGKSSISMV